MRKASDAEGTPTMLTAPLTALLRSGRTRLKGGNARLLTRSVFSILKIPPMTESLRRTGREAQYLSSIRPGIEGYAVGMRMFPRLHEWENQIALQTLREGKTVQDLRNITPFRQYLGVDTRAHLAGEHSPFSSFTSCKRMLGFVIVDVLI